MNPVDAPSGAQGGSMGSGRDGGGVPVDTPPYQPPPPPPMLMGHGFEAVAVGDALAAENGFSVFDGRLLLAGQGSDLGGVADGFVFAHRAVQGNFDVFVRLRSLQMADPRSTAGLMVRAGATDPAAPHVFLGVLADPALGGQIVSRSSAGGATETMPPDSQIRAGQLLRIRREGNRLTLYRSAVVTAWVKLATLEIDLPAEVAVGVALCSRSEAMASAVEVDTMRLFGFDGPAAAQNWAVEVLSGFLPVATLTGGRAELQAADGVFTTTRERGTFLAAPITGSHTLTARVEAIGDEGTRRAQVALTMREGTPGQVSSFGRNVSLVLGQNGQLDFRRRDRGTNFDPGAMAMGITPPVWLRLSRADGGPGEKSRVTASYSSDGVAFTMLDSAEFAFADPALGGIVFTSGSDTRVARTSLSEVNLAPEGTLPPPAPRDAGAPRADAPAGGGGER